MKKIILVLLVFMPLVLFRGSKDALFSFSVLEAQALKHAQCNQKALLDYLWCDMEITKNKIKDMMGTFTKLRNCISSKGSSKCGTEAIDSYLSKNSKDAGFGACNTDNNDLSKSSSCRIYETINSAKSCFSEGSIDGNSCLNDKVTGFKNMQQVAMQTHIKNRISEFTSDTVPVPAFFKSASDSVRNEFKNQKNTAEKSNLAKKVQRELDYYSGKQYQKEIQAAYKNDVIEQQKMAVEKAEAERVATLEAQKKKVEELQRQYEEIKHAEQNRDKCAGINDMASNANKISGFMNMIPGGSQFNQMKQYANMGSQFLGNMSTGCRMLQSMSSGDVWGALQNATTLYNNMKTAQSQYSSQSSQKNSYNQSSNSQPQMPAADPNCPPTMRATCSQYRSGSSQTNKSYGGNMPGGGEDSQIKSMCSRCGW